MATPEWLSVGRVVADPDGDQWRISEVGARMVRLRNPEHGDHGLRKSDVIQWVERGDWVPVGQRS